MCEAVPAYYSTKSVLVIEHARYIAMIVMFSRRSEISNENIFSSWTVVRRVRQFRAWLYSRKTLMWSWVGGGRCTTRRGRWAAWFYDTDRFIYMTHTWLVSGNHRHNLEAFQQFFKSLYFKSCSCAISFSHLQCRVLQLFILEIILEILFEKFKNLSHV